MCLTTDELLALIEELELEIKALDFKDDKVLEKLYSLGLKIQKLKEKCRDRVTPTS